MRCGICGNENADSNYFCGMCGAALAAKTPIPVKAPPTQAPAAQRQNPAAQRRETIPPQATQPSAPSGRAQTAEPTRTPVDLHPGQNTSPVITGPSFLGLNMPAAGRREPALQNSPVHDQLQHSSRSLDYLLEDEEEPTRGSGKLILLVVALLLAAGFGYLRWKQGGFDWLTAGNKNPVPVTPATAGSEGNTADSPGTTGTATDSAATPAAATSTGNPSSSPASSTDPANPATTPVGGAPAPAAEQSSAPQTNSPQTNPPQTAPDQPTPASSAPADSNPTPASASTSQPSDSDAKASQAPPAVTRRPERKPSPARPVDPVAEAERYIYGRGVRQDCDRGIKLLKSAAEQSNPKGMISLGALYSTGTCTPRDLPTAYRWFAQALHKQPDNQPLQDDLQKLWSEMTQPERQLAIKLSQ